MPTDRALVTATRHSPARGPKVPEVGLNDLGALAGADVSTDVDWGGVLGNSDNAKPTSVVVTPSVDELQTITVTGTGGDFTLANSSFDDTDPTDAIPVNSTAAVVQAAIDEVAGAGNVLVSRTGSANAYVYHLKFEGTLAGTNVAATVADGTGVTGGTHESAVATFTTLTGTNHFHFSRNAIESIDFVRGTNATAAAIQADLRTKWSDAGLTVTGTTDAGPFTITAGTYADEGAITVTNQTAGGSIGSVVNGIPLTAVATGTAGAGGRGTASVACTEPAAGSIIVCVVNADTGELAKRATGASSPISVTGLDLDQDYTAYVAHVATSGGGQSIFAAGVDFTIDS